jgi:drug/metabolite transporter (DMT)-like permease
MTIVIFLQLVFATSFLLSKQLLTNINPLWLVAGRITLGGLIILLLAQLLHKPLLLKKSHILPKALVVIFGVVVTNFLEAWGLMHVVAAKGYFIYTFSPFIGALLGFFVFHERMSRLKWVGLLIGFLGFFPLVFIDQTPTELWDGLFNLLPFFGAAISTIIGWTAMKYLIVKENCDFMVANGLTMIAGGFICFLIAMVLQVPLPTNLIQTDTALLFAGLSLTTAISYTIYSWLLKSFSATYTSFAGFIGTLFVALGGWVFLGERLHWPFWVAFCCSCVGVYLFYREEVRQSSIKNT